MSDSIQTILVRTAPGYTVSIGPGLLTSCGQRLREVLGPCRAAVIADSTVAPLYAPAVTASLSAAGFSVCSYRFPAGEAHKNLSTLSEILEFLAREHLTRSDCVVALGGGVAGDMAGFAAAVYLRGIRCVQLPTTLLAAVDSSVGGKTAIDLAAGKNLAGAFLQPAAVLCDTDCLKSLPPDVFADGAAEAIKTGVLCDESLFALFEDGTLTADPAEVIARAAEALGWTKQPIAARIAACLAKNGLPTGTDYTAEALAQAALADKKRAGDSITLVIPQRIGECELRKLPVSDLLPVIRAGLEA